ncbi:MAG: hypothetical protein ACI3VZ_05570 [Faecousia sp.]
MAKRKTDFMPDPQGTGILSKLYMTYQQRMTILRWALYTITCLVLLVAQDVLLCDLKLFGGSVNLAVSMILLICAMQDLETAAVFALVGSCVYLFSDAAPGPYVIVMLTVLGVAEAAFRQSFLRRGFGSSVLCAGVCLVVYEALLFGIGLFAQLTRIGRFWAFLGTTIQSLIALPLLYPLFAAIGKIGGKTWIE